MLDLTTIRQNLEEVKRKIGRKGIVFDDVAFNELDGRAANGSARAKD